MEKHSGGGVPVKLEGRKGVLKGSAHWNILNNVFGEGGKGCLSGLQKT